MRKFEKDCLHFLERCKEDFVVLDDSLFVLVVLGKETFCPYILCSTTFYAMLDLHAGFIQYK